MTQAEAARRVAAMPEAQVVAIAYVEAAGGDAACATRWLAEDLLKVERERDTLLRVVSAGYVRRSPEPVGAGG